MLFSKLKSRTVMKVSPQCVDLESSKSILSAVPVTRAWLLNQPRYPTTEWMWSLHNGLFFSSYKEGLELYVISINMNTLEGNHMQIVSVRKTYICSFYKF